MSPSNSPKSLGGDPATYQQMQQAFFKFSNNTDNSSETETKTSAVVAAEGQILTSSSTSEISPKPSSKDSSLGLESSKVGDTNAAVTVTSNPLMSTQNEQQNNQQSSEKSSEVMTFDRLPLVLNVGGTNPIKPRPAVSGGEVVDTVVSKATTSPAMKTTPISTATAITTNNVPAPKTPERISTTTTTSTKSKGTARRRGKWTVEEEEYVARVIQDFNSGYLNAPAGYTLRSYLSDKLQCDPMRITKKFTGESCIGKRVFHPAVRSAANAAAIDKAQAELDSLERRWRRRLELQQRESAKKAAASAAAANAASRGTVTVQGVPVSMLGTNSQNSTDSQLQQSAVTQAATWLDRANVILMGNIGSGNAATSSSKRNSPNYQQQNKDETRSTSSSMEDSLEHQMKEVQRLIYEGPMIQQTTAGLPNLLLRTAVATVSTERKHGVDHNTIIAPSSIPTHISPTHEPADKRMRMINAADSNPTGAEDAEALVGFLRSVRASAAAGQEL
mmetsp:Transcript_8928/g.22078  ORF Transcript_8928/g.22078 Transcript_8928/m.22078 type:complete len:503 (+) Transcript_8928:398-1906(+)